MAAPRPKKTTVVKKKPPVKKKPSFLRKDTPRPARDVKPGDMRSQVLDKGKPQAAQDLKSGDMRSQSLKGPPAKTGIARGLIKKIPVVGAALGFITDAAPAGAGSDKPVGSVMKSNMPGGYGSKTSGYGPTPKKKASGFGKRISEGAKFERLRASRAAITTSKMSGGGVNNPSGKSSGDALRRAGAGTYFASSDVKAKKSGSSKAASVTPAASSSGTSQATKKKSRSPTRYQRNETAMEQRKSPSGKPKKSILSLFRKG